MITLITGAPGAGKTSAVVAILAAMKEERPVYVHGITDLKLPHEKLNDPNKWYEECPDGALIVIDEVQHHWRPSAAGSKLPDAITLLETHRHRGIDFIIMTQGPNIVHANVRALVGRHIHLRDVGVLGRYWYEWPECCDNVRTGWKNAPVKKRHKLPKKIFDQYKSSVIHNKAKRAIPPTLIILIVALAAASFLGWRIYASIKAKSEPVAKAGQAATAPMIPASGVTGVVQVAKRTHLDDVTDFIPRYRDMPYSAPAYDEIKQVKAVPVITGSICLNGVCRCYHGKGWLRDVSDAACRDWTENRPFDPYTDQQQDQMADMRGNAGRGADSAQGVSAPPS